MYFKKLNFKNQPLNDKKMNIIEMVIVLFFAFCYILPSFEMNIVFMILLCVAYAVFVFGCDPKMGKILFCSLGLCCWISLMYLLLTQSSTINFQASNRGLKVFLSKFHQIFTMFFPVFLLIRVQQKATKKQKVFLLTIIAVIILYVMAITIRELQINPDIAHSWQAMDESVDENFASYYFVYAIPILVAFLTGVFFYKPNIYVKIICLLFIIFSFYFLIESQYTLSILIAIIGLSLAFFKNEKNIILKIVGVFVTIAILIYLPHILKYFSSIIESKSVAVRLEELSNFFSSGDATGYNLNGRLELYWKCIVTFIKSPVWGNDSLGVSGHATFLTILSDTGILGGIPFFYLCFYMRKNVIELLSDEEGLFDVPFIVMVLIGLTNPIESALPLKLALWFVCPLAISLIYEKRRTKNEQMGN